MFKLSEILSLHKIEDVNSFLRSELGYDMPESNINYEEIKEDWRFIGDNESNASVIDQLESGEKGIIERITNAIDAILERKKNELNIVSPKKSADIIKRAFPKFYDVSQKVLKGDMKKCFAHDASKLISVAANDGTKKNTPTIDVVDLGTGIEGPEFKNTILSLHGKNKISEEQSYLIGAFGQGGSTSLSFAASTIIISKKNRILYFTIVRKVHLKGRKNYVYLYFVKGDEVFTLQQDIQTHEDSYFNEFLKNDSGTIVRMIDCDIQRSYRERDITKPRMLGDYFNIELFDVNFPIQLVENRSYLKEEMAHHQNRYVYGSNLKMRTWKSYFHPEFSGVIKILHNSIPYYIEFYIILPTKEDDWANDKECKNVYDQFNIHEKPIFFTVNGQYINGENYTKIQNKGIGFLKYRLLVHVNLDVLGNEKYKYFTTDRSRIKKTDLTSGFIDKIVNQLVQNENIIKINDIISEMSVEKGLDEEELKEISNNVKETYLDFLNSQNNKRHRPGPSPGPVPKPPQNLEYYINDITITNKREEYYLDESIRIMLRTDAYKEINERHERYIYAFLNNEDFYISDKSIMNGRIQYVITGLKPGQYDFQFIMFDEDNGNDIFSNIYSFGIMNEKMNRDNSTKDQNLDLDIQIVKGADTIVRVVKDKEKKKITVYVCLTHEYLKSHYISRTESEANMLKTKLTKPISLMALFGGEFYDSLEPEDQNIYISTFVKTFIKST